MVVVDLPRIAKGASSLQTSRLAPIYNTVTPSLKIFATLFGKALQAQVGPPSAAVLSSPPLGAPLCRCQSHALAQGLCPAGQ